MVPIKTAEASGQLSPSFGDLPRHILDTLLEGCQVISFDWRYLYVNEAVARQGRQSREHLLGHSMMEVYPGIENTAMFMALRTCMQQRTSQRIENEFVFPDGSSGWFELSMQPVPEGVFILSIEITDRKRAEGTLRRLNHALRVLGACNQIIAFATEENQMLRRLCETIVESGGYSQTWICLKDTSVASGPATTQTGGSERAARGTLRPVALAGGVDCLSVQDSGDMAFWAQGPARRTLETGEIAVVRAGSEEKEFVVWRTAAGQRGYGACIALPIRAEEDLIGALTICASSADAFGEDERRLLAESALNIGHGLTTLRARAARRQAEERSAHLNAMLRGIRNVNQLITRERDPQELIGKACKLLVETRGLITCCIVLTEGDQIKLATEGGDASKLKALREMRAHGELPECLQRCLKERTPMVRLNLAGTCQRCPVGAAYSPEQSGLALPLLYEERCYGAMLVTLPSSMASDMEELALLREVAEDLAFAVHGIELQKAHDDGVEKLRGMGVELEAIVQASPAAIFSFDGEGRVLTWNRAAERIFGWTAAKTISELGPMIPPEDQDEYNGFLERILSKDSFSNLEIERLRPDGSKARVSISTAPLRDRVGKITGIMAVAVDLTDRLALEARLRESESRYRSLFECMLEGVLVGELVRDNEGTVIDYRVHEANPAFARLSGRDSGALVGALGSSLFGASPHLEQYARVAETGQPYEFEALFPQLQRHFHVAVIALWKNHFALVCDDITQRKSDEEALRQRVGLQARLAKIAASVPGVIHSFRLRPDGSACMPFTTSAVEDLFGIPQGVLADDVSAFYANVHPEDLRHVTETLAAAARGPTAWHDVYRYVHPRKGLRWIEGWSAPQSESDGSILWHGLMMDITERKLSEEKLVQLSRIYQTLMDTNEAMVRFDEELPLFQHLCQLTLQLGDIGVAWIGLHDPARNALVPRAAAGELAEEIAGLVLPLDPADPAGRALACEAFRKGTLLVRNDYRADAQRSYWHGQPATQGVASALCLPLRRSGQVVGVLSIGARQREFFGPEVVQLFEGMALDLSLGLDKIAQATDLLATLTALQDSDRRLRTMLDNPFLFIGLLDTEGRMLLMNRTVLSVTDCTESELVGLPLWEAPWFTHDVAQQQRLREAVERGARGENSRFEVTYQSGDGQVRHADFAILAVRDEAGRVTWLVPQALDVTERVQTEAALRRSEENYRRLVDNLGKEYFFYQHDQVGVFNYISPSVTEMLGYPVEEMLAHYQTHLTDNPINAKVDEHTALSLQGIPQPPYEVEIYHRDGSPRTLEVTEVPLRDSTGQVIGVEGLAHDITGRKRSEDALRRSEERYRSLVENMDDVVFATDPLGRLTYVSGAVARYGFDPAELIGQSFGRIVHSADLPALTKNFADTLAGWIEPCEFRLSDTAGKIHFVRSSSRAIIENHETVGLTGVLIDFTAQRQTEEQLRQSQKMEAIGRLAGGVAHDFNNLLTVINSYSGFAMASVREGDPLHADLQEVSKAGERAAALTRQLLAFSRRQILQPRVLNLNKVVGGMESMLRRMIGEDIELVTVLAPDLGHVKADPGQIEQVLMNLAVNSRDAMPDGGKLTIATANIDLDEGYASQHGSIQPGPHVMLSVTDTGIGMDEKVKAQIFEPFFTTKEAGKGTGLGLATVYGIVQQSGGNIWVYSEPGQGTTFKLFLPRQVSELEAESAPAPSVTRAVAGETLLVVEDEESVRNLAKRVLNGAGYEVVTAANGGEALLLCERLGKQISLILTDIVMPQMSGKELAERIRSVCPSLRVLYMSGYADDAFVRHGLLEPGMQFIGKPFNAADLTRKVRQVLDS